MAEMMDDVAHLSETIGPRPAGTEEEQQAALFIADELQKEAGFATVIEDFTTVANAELVKLICFAAAFVAALLTLFVPVMAIPSFLLTAVAFVVYGLENILGRPILSRLISSCVSQNVVAKYQPGHPEGTAKRRKIILVANYDSGKVDPAYREPIARFLPIINWIVVGGFAALVLVLFIHMVTPSLTGPGAVVISILTVICMLAVLLPIVDILLKRIGAYSAAANSNASGVAVLLDVARTIGNGMVSPAEMEQAAQEAGVVVHGEEAAREAGAIPADAAVTYAAERTMTPEESLAAAKAAIAAMTGKPVADTVPVNDISAHLVRGDGFSDDPAASEIRFEITDTTLPEHQRAGIADYDYTADYEAEPAPAAPSMASVAEAPVEQPAIVEMHDAPASQDEIEPVAPIAASVPVAAPVAVPSVSADKVPAWARAAQAKAQANRPDQTQNAARAHRSRYADTPAAQMSEAAAHRVEYSNLAPAIAGEAPRPVIRDEKKEKAANNPWTNAPADPVLAARLAQLYSEIESVDAPRVSDETKAEMAAMEAPKASEAPVQTQQQAQTPVVREQKPAPQVSAAPVPEESVAHVAEQAAPAGSLEPQLDEAAEMPVQESAPASDQQPSSRRRGSFATRLRSRRSVSKPSIVSHEEHAAEQPTSAVAPIDVSAFMNKEDEAPVAQDDVASEAPSPVAQRTRMEAVPAEPAAATVSAAADAAEEEPQVSPVAAETTASMEPVQQKAAAKPAAQQAPEPVAPIIGLENYSSSIPALTPEAKAAEAGRPSRQVIVLPEVTLPRASAVDGSKQRAPMDVSNASTRAGSQALLSSMIPRIDSEEAAPVAHREDRFGLDLPSLDMQESDNASVSATGSFATVGGTGAFAPVGDELVADVDPDERYVDDADDSVYEGDFTETGAFAGEGYVDMPKSRLGGFFGRFRKNNRKRKESEAPVWEGDDYGFSDEEQVLDEGVNFVDVDYPEDDDLDDRRGWNGGGFSLDRLRNLRRKGGEPADLNAVEATAGLEDGYGEYAPADGYQEPGFSGDPAEQINEEMRRIQSFRHPDIDTEVWFVALGAELSGNSGMEAFLTEHASELKGSIIVNLDSLGAGRLTYLESEGLIRPMKPSSRIKRFLRDASNRSDVSFATGMQRTRTTSAQVAARHGLQAFTIAGMDGENMALYASADDVIENVSAQTLDEASAFILGLVKSI